MTSLKIQKNGTDGWYMTTAEVTDTVSLVTVTFTCDCWLDVRTDGALEYILHAPGKAKSETRHCMYVERQTQVK